MTARISLLAAMAAALAVVAFAAPAGAEDELSPAELLALYQPVTVLDRTEAFAPTSVEDFLADADLQRLGDDGQYHTVPPPHAGLPVDGDGWRLDHRGCTPIAGLASIGCYAAAQSGPSVVYARHEVRAGTIVLQYWYFYDYDLWSMPLLPPGFVWQAHEGDWEVVSVVLDDEQNPVQAAYSQHCTGEKRAWANVQKQAGTHPFVYVATGSHANLFAAGLHPISLSCYPAEAVQFFQAIGVPPLDVIVPGPSLGPVSTSIERVHDNEPRWLRFPGTWGETQYIFALPVSPLPIAFGTSPTGPQDHDVWVDPLGTIAGYPVG